MEHLFLFIMLALLAEIIGTVSGFGSSLLFVPIAGFFLDFQSVLGITALFHLSSNVTKIAFFKKGIDKKIVLSIGVPAVLFVILGAWLSRFFDKRILEILLASFLILLSLLFLIFKNYSVKPSLFNAFSGGALSGLTAGLMGTGGAVRGITLAAFNLEKEVFIATSAIIDLAIDFSRGVVYYSNGYMHGHDLYLVPILFGVSVAGTYAGSKLLHLISETRFKQIVLLLILSVGTVTLVKQIL